MASIADVLSGSDNSYGYIANFEDLAMLGQIWHLVIAIEPRVQFRLTFDVHARSTAYLRSSYINPFSFLYV